MKQKVGNMLRINEATATDTDTCLILAGTSLKVIERLQQLGWKREGALLYQQEYVVLSINL